MYCTRSALSFANTCGIFMSRSAEACSLHDADSSSAFDTGTHMMISRPAPKYQVNTDRADTCCGDMQDLAGLPGSLKVIP
jgi:hypothetical protein